VKIVGIQYKNDIAAEPHDEHQPGTIIIDLSGIHAVRFKAVLGSDYPPGDELNKRKTFSVRSQGTEARFLTLIEPYESDAVVKSATADSFDAIHVQLADGREQKLTIRNFEGDGKNVSVDLTESKEGKVLRTESTR
jgi:hypothetical protein